MEEQEKEQEKQEKEQQEQQEQEKQEQEQNQEKQEQEKQEQEKQDQNSNNSSIDSIGERRKKQNMEYIGREIQKRIDNEAAVKSRSFDRSFDHRSFTSVSLHQRIADSDTLSQRSKRFLTDYIERLEELIWVHSKSAEYYERRNNYITIPSIILTSASAVVSLLASSSSASAAFHYSSAVSVGVIAAVSSIFQALSSTLKYGTKAELHREVADRYSKIVTTIKFEMIDNSTSTEDNFLAELEKQILDIQNYCKYLPPMFFYELYRKTSKI